MRVHPFHILSASWAGLEWIGKVLRLSRHLFAPELHDAHRVGWLAIIGQDEFGDPKITAANDSLDRKALPVRLDRAGDLDIAPAAYALALLGVFQHRVLVIDAVLGFKIVGIGGRPMLIQCRAYLLISHLPSRATGKLRLPYDLVSRGSNSYRENHLEAAGFLARNLFGTTPRRSRQI